MHGKSLFLLYILFLSGYIFYYFSVNGPMTGELWECALGALCCFLSNRVWDNLGVI